MKVKGTEFTLERSPRIKWVSDDGRIVISSVVGTSSSYDEEMWAVAVDGIPSGRRYVWFRSAALAGIKRRDGK
jgi:hypothetical protein